MAIGIGWDSGCFEKIRSLYLVVEIDKGILDDSVKFFDRNEDGELSEYKFEEHLEKLTFGHYVYLILTTKFSTLEAGG